MSRGCRQAAARKIQRWWWTTRTGGVKKRALSIHESEVVSEVIELKSPHLHLAHLEAREIVKVGEHDFWVCRGCQAFMFTAPLSQSESGYRGCCLCDSV